jgi:sugar phosphate isomerase/epimerase
MIELLSADWNHWPDVLDRSEIVATASRLGVAGLELGVYDTEVELAAERVAEWNELGAVHGIGIRALLYSMPPDRWPSGGLANPNSRKRLLEQAEELLDIAVDLQLDTVGLWPGADSPHADRAEFLRTLSELAALASRRNIRIAIEPKPETIVATPDDVTSLSGETRHPDFVGLLLDTGHELAAGRDPAEIVRSLEVELLHVHLGDSDGDPDADLPAGRIHSLDGFFAALVAIDYDGAMSPDAYGAVEAGVVTGTAALEETVRYVADFWKERTV